jgi:hypothetical protein
MSCFSHLFETCSYVTVESSRSGSKELQLIISRHRSFSVPSRVFVFAPKNMPSVSNSKAAGQLATMPNDTLQWPAA